MSSVYSPAQLQALAALELGPHWVPANRPQGADVPVPLPDSVTAQPADFVPAAWDQLAQQVRSCQRCGLCKTRKNTVFGAGAETARWMVIGEAPGEQEDLSGQPFVGPAGQLLDAMLAAVGVSRENNVYIANTIKCRPPGNRDPSPEEQTSCLPYLQAQVAHVNPALLLLMGRSAAQSVLNSTDTIASLRGKLIPVSLGGERRQALVTYHPSYLLRNPAHKARAWQDLVLAKNAVAPG
jgi:uracil-DNA glycosylase